MMESFKEQVENLYGGMKERLKSPFILTFVTVWIVRHWELVYLVFNFGANYTAIQKLKMVTVALKGESYWELFWIPLFVSLVSFAGYLVISLAYELIHSLYSKWGRTFIYFISDRNKLVLREEYEKIEKAFSKLDKSYTEMEVEYEEQKQDNLDTINKLNASEETVNDLKNELKEIELEKTDLANHIIGLQKIEEKYNAIKNNENEFVRSNAKLAMYYLFKYLFIEKVQVFNYIPLTDLFFGKWKKSIYKPDDYSVKLSVNQVTFEKNNVIDENGNFIFEIIDVGNIMAGAIFIVNTRNKQNRHQAEVLFKLNSEFYYGLIGGFTDVENTSLNYNIKNNFRVEYIVEYEKIKT